jgi:hypothetical protein
MKSIEPTPANTRITIIRDTKRFDLEATMLPPGTGNDALGG